ncbi:MAG: SIR2 family protein, partial [Pirellulaceae bacterium]|nr:SIR2 family protein [Pirellulaceae bacterium]
MNSEEHKSVHLYNQPSFAITNMATQNFISDVQQQLGNGYGFVPFIGAGLSAPSGIPLIWEIESYLRRCIALSLGVVSGDKPHWNPRADKWPPFRIHDSRLPNEWISLIRVAMESLTEGSHQDWRVFQESLGAMADWRTALLFLARIVREQRGTGRNKSTVLLLDAPKQEVIDAGIREIMKGKHPTLGHRMLAALGGILRLDVILTTNFDDLLEQAFRAAKNPLTVFGLHLASQLPPHAALSPHRSLVKLHGDRHSLRADYSLDEIPPTSDLWRFLEYLLSVSGHNDLHHETSARETSLSLEVSSHLLVMGVSAN